MLEYNRIDFDKTNKLSKIIVSNYYYVLKINVASVYVNGYH